jgi:fermentation-respiration switch protein FrsA (DUF1100 family)
VNSEAEPPEATSTVALLKRRRVPRAFVILPRLAILSYVGWCIALYVAQNRILFPSDLARASTVEPTPKDAEKLWLDIDGGQRVEGWLFKPASAHPGDRLPAVIFFHGNAETIDDSIGHAELYTNLGFAVLLPEYRGYGRSGGSPSQSAIAADILRFHDMLAARPDIDPARIIYHGRSIGGGVACELARTRPPVAMVLESTFTSVAGFSWRFGIPPILCSNPFRNDNVVRTLETPLLIMHGTDDDIVPVAHGRALRDLARHGTYIEMPGRHNDFPSDWRLYERSIATFVSSFAQPVTAQPGAR